MNNIGGYRWFVSTVKSKGGIWASEDVYFSQMRDFYGARYCPNYPEKSEHDQTLEYNHFTSTWSHYGATAVLDCTNLNRGIFSGYPQTV